MSPWVRLDDSAPDDPRLAAVGSHGRGILVDSLCYSNRHLTDGWVPRTHVFRWAAEGSDPEAATKLVASLLQFVVLTPEAREGIDGFRIHQEYVGLQPTRDQVMKQRREKNLQKAVAGRLGGRKSGEARRKHAEAKAKQSEAEPSAQSEQTEPPIPFPIPSGKSIADAIPHSRVVDRNASHELLCRLFHEVWDRETTRPDRIEAVKQLMAQRDLTASVEALQSAEEKVAFLRDLKGVVPREQSGWTKVGRMTGRDGL